MTTREATAKLLAAIEVLDNPVKSPLFTKDEESRLAAYMRTPSPSWEQTRSAKKAQIAENTRISNERAAMEAAKNESPPTFFVDPGQRLPKIPVRVAEKTTAGLESPEARFVREMDAIDKRRQSRAPVAPPPKCIGSLKEHGPLVERWRGSLLGGTSKVLMCDGCYVHAERLLAEDEHSRDIAGPALSPGPTTRTGLVPQSFGDERVGGIWASRGMR